jgi:hypothetical protein
MKKETVIAVVIVVAMLATMAGVGFAIWRASNSKKISTKQTHKSLATSAPESTDSSLNVGDGSGLGGGIDLGQSQGSGTGLGSSSGSGQSSSSSSKKGEDFSQYAKYQDGKEALFGEIKKGDGAEVVVNKKVAIYYTGRTTDGKIFDQTAPEKVGQQPKPLVFAPGKHEVVLGLEQGILGMKVGGKRRIIIPPAVGYGKEGQGPIPPNTLMIFDVELIEVEK